MAIPSSAVSGPIAELRLRQLELTVAEVHDPIVLGYAAAATCTEHEPRSLPGTLVWGRAIGALRDTLKPRGWTVDRAMNFETVVHPTGSHAIAVAAGTSQTGVDGPPPRTKTPKGPATTRAVGKNRQLLLDQGTGVFDGTGDPVDSKDRETWLLLHYPDVDADEIRLELACPLEMNGPRITAWRERILLPPLPYSAHIVFDFDEEDEVIEIDIQRKAD